MRKNVRGVLLTPGDRILMMKLREPVTKNEFWITPGGTVEPEEDFESALYRELKEETGREGFQIGSMIWTRESTYTWNKRTVTHREHYYFIETEQFNPQMMDDPESSEVKAFQGFRWWTANKIRDSNGHFGPEGIADFLEVLIKDGIPKRPIDLGSWIHKSE
ncbi:MAG: NUDIX domain-containing protein [Candidatus Latescibacteria bacterium]|nr:NUDIX domain-containing protein [Candidatus Latescibacterota bacterium]